MGRILAGLSTRGYPVGLEPVGAGVEAAATATSKSAVSRRFVAMTETALADLLSADLSGLDLVALMIDGVHFAESAWMSPHPSWLSWTGPKHCAGQYWTCSIIP